MRGVQQFNAPRAKQLKTSKTRKENMSLIWTYFTLPQDGPKHAVCNACKSKVSHGGSTPKTFGTTNLIGHLEKKHPGLFSKYKEDTAAKRRDAAESQQPQQPSTVAPMFDINTEKSNASTRKIMEFYGTGRPAV